MRIVLLSLLCATPALWAQLKSNTITVTASRTAAATPDRATFNLFLITSLDATFDQVLGSLETAGITAANLTNVNQSSYGISIGWSFTFDVPSARLQDTLKSLATMQTKVGSTLISFNARTSWSYPPTGDLIACPLPDLLADAKVQAQQYASASGVTVGPIQALADQPISGPGGLGYVAGAFLASSPYFLLAPITTTCSLTVQFGIVRF